MQARIWTGWNKDASLIMIGKLSSSCVRNSMLHRSETWPVRKENEVALQWAEMRIVRWMHGIKLKDRFPSKELRKRLGIDDITLVLCKIGCDGMGMSCKKMMIGWRNVCSIKKQNSTPRGRPKRTWRDVVKKDCQAQKLNEEDTMEKLIKDVRWSGLVRVGESFLWYRPTQVVPDKGPLNGCECVRTQ